MNNTSFAEIQGAPAPIPIFPTLTEAWLNVTQDEAVGITFHSFKGESLFYSYSSLLEYSQKIAAGLKEKGIAAHDRIAIVLPTSSEFIQIYFGILLAGAIPVPLYPPMGALSLKSYRIRTQEMLSKVTPRILVTNSKLRNFLSPLVKSRQSLGVYETEELVGDVENYVTPSITPKDITLIQFSSGTTAVPKPVALSHRNLMANITAISCHYQECEPVRLHNFSWLPLYHDLGLIGNVLMPMIWNCPNELLSPQDFITRPWLWLQLMSKTGAISSTAPNFAYAMCLKRVKDEHMEGVDLSDWQWAINGAEMVNPQIADEFESRFSKWGFQAGTIIPAYGLSEASLAVSIGPVGSGLKSKNFNTESLEKNDVSLDTNGKKIVSAGRPLWGTRIRIGSLHSPKKKLEEGKIGEVLVHSKSVMEGYLKPDGSIDSKTSEWLSTGDLGFVFEDQLYICGRTKNLIIKNGRNIHPHDLENSILRLGGNPLGGALNAGGAKGWSQTIRPPLGGIPQQNTQIENCVAVSQITDESEAVYLFVEIAKGAQATYEELIDIQNGIKKQILEEHGILIDQVVLLKKNAIPRTSSGKLRHQYTLEIYLNGELLPFILSQK